MHSFAMQNRAHHLQLCKSAALAHPLHLHTSELLQPGLLGQC